MNELIKIDYMVSSCIYTIRDKFGAIDLHQILNNETYLKKSLLQYFEELVQLSKQSNSAMDLQVALANLKTFTIDADIEIEIDQWIYKLIANLKDGSVTDHVNTYLTLYNKNYFDLFSNKISMDGVASIWAASATLPANKRRFIAMLILYCLTKAFAKDVNKFGDELISVESYFVIRNYLLYGQAFDLFFFGEAFDNDEYQSREFIKLETLKSMFTFQELSLLSETPIFKAITAASGVAQSLEREDLEGGKNKKNKKTAKKRYNRIEKLEED